MFHEKHHGGDYCTVLYIVLWQTCDKMCQRLSGASDSPTLGDSLAQTTLKSQRLSGANSYKKNSVKHYDGITYCNNLQIVTEYQNLML